MRNESSLIGFIKGKVTNYKQNIEIIGNKIAIVENIDSIIEYSEESIRLLVEKKYILICGCGLRLDNYSDKSVIIKGRISKIIFE